MPELRPGERLDLGDVALALRINAANETALARLNALVIPLGADDRLIADFGPLQAGDRELRPGIAFQPGYGIDLDLGQLPASVAKLTIIVYVIGGPGCGMDIADLGTLTMGLPSDRRFRLDLHGRRESALILAEVYRRNGAWRLAAGGQGFTTGIPGVARALGVELDVPDAVPARSDDRDRGYYGDRPAPGTTASGSGFAVAPRLIVTNFHVIEHAVGIHAAGTAHAGPAQLVMSDAVNDIALLALDHDAQGVVRFRPDLDIDLGEDVVVAGFPLQQLLGQGPQVSGGNVSALTGLRGDSGQVQFNSPIGSGSSGGPMLDSAGLLVGLVKSVLRSDPEGGQIAQNINFGVKAALVRSFLHAAGVAPVMGSPGAARPRAEVARELRAYLYRINTSY